MINKNKLQIIKLLNLFIFIYLNSYPFMSGLIKIQHSLSRPKLDFKSPMYFLKVDASPCIEYILFLTYSALKLDY